MKNLSRLLFAMLLVFGFSNTYAQDENNPWAISVGINAVDFFPTGEDAPLGGTFDEFFNYGDHYNVLPSLSTVTVSRYLQDGFSLGVTGSLNKIEKWGDAAADNLSYYGLDGTITYSLGEKLNLESFEPYLGLGGGYTWVDEIGAGTLNGSLGFNYWFTDHIGVNVQSSYKHAFEDYLQTHFQHKVGISIKFGGTDTDGDGIYDKDDACPDVAGLEAFNGCPDTDGDGIQDSEDACPMEAGLAEFNGCPDGDGDGVPDKDDACPTEAGTASLNGCPDRDGDGVADKDDKCPDVAGPAANDGCPWPDSDGDGIADKDDECPNIAGVAENNGCPIVSAEVQKEITDLARAIYFVTGSSKFTNETEIRMEQISNIVNQYKTLRFDVEGHTDSTGSDKINNKLSQARADAVRTYLVENGFPADMITAKGFGSSNPIGDNKTSKGRQQNRRVEIFSEYAER